MTLVHKRVRVGVGGGVMEWEGGGTLGFFCTGRNPNFDVMIHLCYYVQRELNVLIDGRL